MINKENDKITNTIQILLDERFIPETGNFDIDEHLLKCYIKIYASFSNNGNKKFNYLYARKLAARSFIDLKRKREIKTSDIKEGFVYLIINPAWPEFGKVGIAIDPYSRLSTYQTGDPHRSYKINNYEFVLDRKSVEKDILSNFKTDLHNGEWLRISNIDKIFKYVRDKHINIP